MRSVEELVVLHLGSRAKQWEVSELSQAGNQGIIVPTVLFVVLLSHTCDVGQIGRAAFKLIVRAPNDVQAAALLFRAQSANHGTYRIPEPMGSQPYGVFVAPLYRQGRKGNGLSGKRNNTCARRAHKVAVRSDVALGVVEDEERHALSGHTSQLNQKRQCCARLPCAVSPHYRYVWCRARGVKGV
jgi:hypothetical protein